MKAKRLCLKILILAVFALFVFTGTSCFALCSLGVKLSSQSCSKERADRELSFTLNDDGDGYILSRVGVELNEVVIPEKHEGLPVVGIGEYAFTPYVSYGCGGEYSPISPFQVVIPASIKFIGHRAFEQNTINEVIYDGSLEEWFLIKIEDSTPFTEKTRFLVNGTEQVVILTVPDSVKAVSDFAFFGLGTLKSVTFHGGVEEIGMYSFARTGITSLELPDSVTSVNRSAFCECEALKEATLSANLAELPDRMFMNCYNLGTVKLKCGIEVLGRYAFTGCESLRKFDLSLSTLKVIPECAFAGCQNLNAITIPESVVEIEDDAFASCYRLFEVYNYSDLNIFTGSYAHGGVALYAVAVYDDPLDESAVHTRGEFLFSKTGDKNYLLKYTGNSISVTLPESFDGEDYALKSHVFSRDKEIRFVTLPEAVTEIGEFAFNECSSLVKIIGAAGVTKIGYSAFGGCENLVSDIPCNAVEIGKNAYFGCASLTAVTIPKGLEIIEDSTFSGCEKLAKVTFPETLKMIGSNAFYYCTALEDIVIPRSVEDVQSKAFASSGVQSVEFLGGKKIGTEAFLSARRLREVTHCEGLERIGSYAFAYCESLEELHIPSTLQDIDVQSLYMCPNLKKLSVAEDNAVYAGTGNCIIEKSSKTLIIGCDTSVIPDDGSVTKIGARAFSNCGFTSFTVPDSVTEIGEFAFHNCRQLKTINIGSGVVYFGYNILTSCENLSDLYYGGTKSQFEAIEKVYDCFISYQQTIYIHCKNSLPYKYTQK